MSNIKKRLVKAEEELQEAIKRRKGILNDLEEPLRKLASIRTTSIASIRVLGNVKKNREKILGDLDRISREDPENLVAREKALIALKDIQNRISDIGRYWFVFPGTLTSYDESIQKAIEALSENEDEIALAEKELKDATEQHDTERKMLAQELEHHLVEERIEEHTKVLKSELKQLAATTVSQSDWEAADHKLEKILGQSIDAKQERKKILGGLQALERIAKSNAQFLADIDENFLQPYGATLTESAEQHQQESLEQAELAKALKYPGSLQYYHTLVSSMNNLYLAASVSTTGYIPVKNKGVLKKVSVLLEVIGKLAPAFGQYIEAGAKVLDAIGLRWTKKNLNKFSKLADSPEEMNALIKEVAYQLVLTNSEEPTNKQAKAHLRKMIKAVFDGKIKKGKDKQKLINELLNAAEGEDIHAKRKKLEGNRTPSKTPLPIKALLKKHSKRGYKQAEVWSSDIDKRRFSITQNPNTFSIDTLNKGNIEPQITLTLHAMYDYIFEEVEMKPKKKGLLKLALCALLVEEACTNTTLVEEFRSLSEKDEEEETIIDKLKVAVEQAVKEVSEQSNVKTKVLAETIVGKLLKKPVSRKEQGKQPGFSIN